MRQEVLRMERVSSQEHGVMQLDGFNLSILAGEIMGLLPLNNHGLTALLSLLQRNTPLRYGYVYYREEQVNTWRNTKHRRNRIGLIQSESCLVEGLTVADNIFVLRPEFKTWMIRPSLLKKQLVPFLKSLGIDISTDAYVDELSAFEKKVVDILKPVVAGCKLIVLRDISANISEEELQKIHRLLRHYAGEGISFLYIDFHIEELRRICGKVAFMSNGKIVKTMRSAEIISDSFHHDSKLYAPPPEKDVTRPVFESRGVSGALDLPLPEKDVSRPVFEARGVSGALSPPPPEIVNTMRSADIASDRFRDDLQLDLPPPEIDDSRQVFEAGGVSGALDLPLPEKDVSLPVFEARSISGALVADLSFSVAPGECLVLQNEDIQVLGEFLSILSGETAPLSGEILVDGRPVPPRIGENLAIIQEIPTVSMLFKELSYMDNLCFMLDRRLPEIWRDQSVRDGVRREYAALLGEDVFDERIEALSEMQKYELVYTRIAIQKPKVAFCVQPFRRADMGLRLFILELIGRLTDKGVAVVILAVNLTDRLLSGNRIVQVSKPPR